jgi:hypothetical protein
MNNDIDNVFDWIVRIIETCYHDFHFDCADKLIELFYLRFGNESKKNELIKIRNERYYQVRNIIY